MGPLVGMLGFFLVFAPAFQSSPANSTPTAKVPTATQAAADRFQQKVDYIKRNGALDKPAQRPTVVTEEELNAYFAAGRVKLTPGLNSVKFRGEPGVLTSDLSVDFDQLTAGRRSYNPLLSLFTGVHEVQVVANGEASGGIAHAHVQSVMIDGMEVPRIALELFVDKFLKPKYPQAGLDSDFKMPSKMDVVVLGKHKFTVTQK